VSAAIAFGLAYFLSYLFRSVNAVVSPELTRDLALDPASLGLLTSAYFLAFGLIQVPAGMLLDRYGPRRVEPVLLTVAAAGAFAFAASDTLSGLTLARAAIGAGVSVCLMAPLKAIAVWQPYERHASFAGWLMVAGGLGAIGASAPLEFALRFAGWRAIFAIFGGVALAVALLLALRVPDLPHATRPVSVREQWAGVRTVFRDRRFWWIAPLGGFGMGSFMAIQGLWAVPWLMDVGGTTRAEAARHLLVMGCVSVCGYLGIAMFAMRLARRGIHSRHLFLAGFTLNALALLAICARVPGSYLWWSLYSLGAAVNVLAFTVLSAGFGMHLAARASTALNLIMFGGSFAVQWGIGVIAEAAAGPLGVDIGGGLRIAFAVVLACDALTLAWFAWGWRRHGAARPAAVAA
jgi:predicted MFS family arabinose efflux permease